MKAVILAAGEGKRLRPYTKHQPKCMVSFQEKKIIDRILHTLARFPFQEIGMVTGYQADKLRQYVEAQHRELPIRFYENRKYAHTNMVHTLFCAEETFDDDLLISYADIIYRKDVVDALLQSKAPISVVVDKDWENLWRARMENPLEDAETLKLNSQGRITEIGKKPNTLADISGQYIGLIQIRKEALREVCRFYHQLDCTKIYDGQTFPNMYMTTFLQLLIDWGMDVQAVWIHGGWLEIDTVDDLHNLTSYWKER